MTPHLMPGPASYPPPPAGSAHLDMLRQVTRRMAVTHDRQAVLGSITNALVEHTGAALSRIFLYLNDDECEVCRTHGPTGEMPSEGKRALHLSASAGLLNYLAGPHHLLPLHFPTELARVAATRIPWRNNDIPNNPMKDPRPEARRWFMENGLMAAAGYPLDFHDELVGVIGMIKRTPIADDEFELLGIFADQAAMAIKSTYLLEELNRHRNRLHAENEYLQEEIRGERGFEHIIGASQALRSVLRKVERVATVETSVLLTGETGTGKELVARAIHEGSPRRERPLIKVNCGAIPAGLMESELFGHEKGAFTGALQRRIGRFELADKGTLFLDEVGELPLDMQVKLLRVLQEQEFERVGSTRPIRTDVRLIGATNRDLEREVAEGRFRADLFYRLNVFPIHVPPLRERPGDIPVLVRHFLAHFQRKLAKPLRDVTPDSLAQLERYPWPGNIRELQNVLERACVLARGPVVDVGDSLTPADRAGVRSSGGDGPILTLDDAERAHIRRALASTEGKIYGPRGAAALLGVNPSTLRSRMERLGVAKSMR